MTNFSTKPTERDFETAGGKVSLELKPLKRGAMLKLVPFMKDTQGVEAVISMYEIQGVAAEISPDHVKVLDSDLTVDDEPLTVSHIVDIAPFAPLCMDIVLALVDISKLSAVDSKNSNGPITYTAQGEESQS